MKTRIAVGIGCRAGISSAPIVALVREIIARAELRLNDANLFTIEAKRNEAGLAQAALQLDAPLHFLPRVELAAISTPTQSSQSLAAFGVSSIAESAALAGAGEGAVLIVPRVARDGVTCAVARVG